MLRQLQIFFHILPGPGRQYGILCLLYPQDGSPGQVFSRFCQTYFLAFGTRFLQVKYTLGFQFADGRINGLLAESGKAADLREQAAVSLLPPRLVLQIFKLLTLPIGCNIK